MEYGAEEQITVFLDEKESSVPQPISRGQIAEFVTEQGNPGNPRGARLLRIQTPNERLKDGLVPLDTPGAGSLDAAHTAVTYAVLGSADVGIFVIGALTPLTVQELSMRPSIRLRNGPPGPGKRPTARSGSIWIRSGTLAAIAKRLGLAVPGTRWELTELLLAQPAELRTAAEQEVQEHAKRKARQEADRKADLDSRPQRARDPVASRRAPLIHGTSPALIDKVLGTNVVIVGSTAYGLRSPRQVRSNWSGSICLAES